MLGAFGIYSKHRLPADNFIELGTESLLGPSYIYYFKDKFFIIINSLSRGLPDFESMYGFARSIDSLVPGSPVYPQQLMVFPQKRLVAHSEKFLINGLESFAAPESCFTADYARGDDTSTVFYSLNRTEPEFRTLVKVINRKGRILSNTAGVGRNSGSVRLSE